MRVLADWVSELGRAREQRQARAVDDRAQARRRSARCSASRSAPSTARRGARAANGRAACRTRRSSPRSRRSSTRFDGDEPLALRNRAWSSSSTPPACAAPRRSRSTSATSTSSRSSSTSATARARRTASSRSARRPRARRALPRERGRSSPAAPRTRSSSRRAAAASTRRRCAGSSPTRTGFAMRSRRTCSRAAPTCGRSRSCSATARSRRRRCTATSTRSAYAASTTTRIPEVMKANRDAGSRGTSWRCSRARASPRTVDAYTRDLDRSPGLPRQAARRCLARGSRALHGPASCRRPRRLDDRAAHRGRTQLLSPPPTPRHARRQPRRRRSASTPCASASEDALPGEAERLIDAAAGTEPRALRDQALVELLYGAGLRVSEAVGLDQAGVDLDGRLVRVIGKGGKERVVPVGRAAVTALRRYLVARPAVPRPAPPGRALPERARRRSSRAPAPS